MLVCVEHMSLAVKQLYMSQHETSWRSLRSTELPKTFIFNVCYMQVEHYIELCPNTLNHAIAQVHLLPKVMEVVVERGVSQPNCSGFSICSLQQSCLCGIMVFAQKGLCEHPISNQQNQHNLSQWIIPIPPPST